MKIYTLKFFILLAAALSFFTCKAQEDDHAFEESEAKHSIKTHYHNGHQKKWHDKTFPVTIITHTTKGILYGNPCVKEHTDQLGVLYHLETTLENISPIAKWLHNARSYILLSLKNGPLWKSKLNKRIKYCQKMTGDYPG